MLQYLLNTTAIWLISLVMFELFLRRESFHSYNRFYLLFTFLLGALLPLWQWQGKAGSRYEVLQQPLDKVVNAKKTFIAADSQATAMGTQWWIVGIYGLGVLVALCMLISEVIKLARFYRAGHRSSEGRWAIIDTGKEHAPFSFINTLFVSNKELYSSEEWTMILAHEDRHTTLLHIADLVFLQLARILFWFHPLVYIYSKRLLLVHEYQADNASAERPQEYGRFLIEQALLPVSPVITHSFNRSPIKKRIIMLTSKSTYLAKSKMLVFVPVAAVCLLCFSKNVFAQKFVRKGNTVTYRGNVFELSKGSLDTIIVVDPVTAEEVTKIMQVDPMPLKMNDNPIPKEVDKQPVYTGSEGNLRDYLLRNMKPELSKLGDGNYRLYISEILVDEHGKIVYFNYENIKRSKTKEEMNADPKSKIQVSNTSDPKVNVNIDGKNMSLQRNANPANYAEVNDQLQEEIFNKVCDLMETAPGFEPAKANGKNVVGVYDCLKFYNHFKVKDHKLYDVTLKGEFEELK